MQRCELDLKGLVSQYASYVHCVCNATANVDVEDLRYYLLSIPAFRHSDKESKLLSSISDDISRAT